MIINLFEIPEDGKNFHYTQETKEVSEVLKDLIDENAYHSEFFIKPLNSKDFELKGFIKTRTKEICSYCGLKINYPISTSFHEILIPHQEVPRDGKYSKVNHFSEMELEGPDSYEYSPGMKFNIGEYLHEAIALKVPFNPAPDLDQKGECLECHLDVKETTSKYFEDKDFSSDKAPIDTNKKNPFSVLKDLIK